ncbi:MAG: DUF655 domain-containing protein [Candidatus Aenigmatarchaeota archaeon]
MVAMREEKCIILDFLPTGYPERRHAEPIAQAIGRNFTLLELVPKEGVTLKPEEEVYVGEGPRDKVKTVKGVMPYSRLTNFSRSLLPAVVERLVKEEEKRFVYFFNTSGVITPRMHKLELLPGIGKKHVQDFLDARRKKPFESFADIRERVRLFPDPVKAVVQRILLELEGNEKYYIFTPPKRPSESGS